MCPVSVIFRALPLGAIFSKTNDSGSPRPHFFGVDRRRASRGQDALNRGERTKSCGRPPCSHFSILRVQEPPNSFNRLRGFTRFGPARLIEGQRTLCVGHFRHFSTEIASAEFLCSEFSELKKHERSCFLSSKNSRTRRFFEMP